MDPNILWSQPGDREPAPSVSLHLLQDFVNTNDVEGGDDGLGSPGLLRDWLAEGGLMGRCDGGGGGGGGLLGDWLADRGLMARSDEVTEPAWRRAIDVREGLRALGKVNNGEPLD